MNIVPVMGIQPNNLFSKKETINRINNKENCNNISLSSQSIMSDYNKARISFTGKKSLHNQEKNGILAGIEKDKEVKEMSLYSTCTGHEFSSDSETKQNFDNAIRTFMTLDKEGIEPDINTTAKFYTSCINSMIEAYNDGEINKDYMMYIFCSLLECMDKAESEPVLESANYCLFDNFIPEFKKDETLRDMTKQIISSDLLQNQYLKIRINNVINS